MALVTRKQLLVDDGIWIIIIKRKKIRTKIPSTIVKFITMRNFFIKNDNNIMYHAYLDNFDIDGIRVKDVDDVRAFALAHCTSC